ncbi:MAG: oxygenase MpaB family protein, partial [Weeksellaceae bacterium]
MIKNDFNDKFWTLGNGQDFIKWSNEDIEVGNYDTSLFESYDKELDTLVQKWLDDDEFGAIMQSLHHSNNEELPPSYLDFRESYESIPSWVNSDLITSGSELSERSGLIGLLVLRNFALLGGYNFANLTKPLVATGALEKGAVNRLTYTLDFWVNVSRTDKDAQQRRINACIRTRLVHCASRIMINKKEPNWEVEKYGIPINHADMVATNIAFTVYFLYGLSELKFNYSEQEEEGIFHLWKYVTYMLGVPLDIIPSNKKEALEFFKFWMQYQNKPDEDSIKLTNALLDENTPISLLKLDIVKRNMGYIHRSVSNFLLAGRTPAHLHLPPVRFPNLIPHA